jgi:hypothetical protein
VNRSRVGPRLRCDRTRKTFERALAERAMKGPGAEERLPLKRLCQLRNIVVRPCDPHAACRRVRRWRPWTTWAATQTATARRRPSVLMGSQALMQAPLLDAVNLRTEQSRNYDLGSVT